MKIEFPAAERAEAVFRSFDTIEHITGCAPGLTDCIVGMWWPFLVEVSQIPVKFQLLPYHTHPPSVININRQPGPLAAHFGASVPDSAS